MKNINKIIFVLVIGITLLAPTHIYAEEENPEILPVAQSIIQNDNNPSDIPEEQNDPNEPDNDINSDGQVNNKDVDDLKDEILKDEIKPEEEPNLDINDDKEVDVKDLVSLDNIIKGQQPAGETSKASFDVKTTKRDKIVFYEVYLKTDGVVRSFMFDMTKTNNLKMLNCEANDDISFLDNGKKLRLIGLGNFLDYDLLITMYYRITNYNKATIRIKDGMIVFDNDKFVDNLNYDNNFKLPRTNKIIPTNNSNSNNYYPIYLNNNVNLNNDKTKKVSNNSNSKKEKKSINKKKEKAEEKKEEAINLKNIIKISLIVLLGALIIYLLNNETDRKDEKEIKEK